MRTLTWHHEQTEMMELANLMPTFHPNTRKLPHQKPKQTPIIANNTLTMAANEHLIAMAAKPSNLLINMITGTINWIAVIPELISTVNFCYSMKKALNLLICHALNSTNTLQPDNDSALFSRKFIAHTNFGFTSKTMQKISTHWCMDWSKFWYRVYFSFTLIIENHLWFHREHVVRVLSRFENDSIDFVYWLILQPLLSQQRRYD